jgi:hypothetical protein
MMMTMRAMTTTMRMMTKVTRTSFLSTKNSVYTFNLPYIAITNTALVNSSINILLFFAGMMQSLLEFLYDVLCCRFHIGKYKGQGRFDDVVKDLPPMSEVLAAPLLEAAEDMDALNENLSTQNSGYR